MTDDPHEPLPAETPSQGDLFDAASRLKLDLNDTGNAKRLVGVLKSEAVYVVGRGWGVWDSKIYNFEGGTARMLALAGSRLQRLLEEEAAALESQPVSKEAINSRMAEKGEDRETAERKIRAGRRASRRDFAKTCGNISRIRNAVELAASDFMVELEAFDSDRTVLQVQNGTLDLSAIADVPEHEEAEEREARWRAALRPHDRSTLPTRVAGTTFEPEAACPEWERFIALAQPNEAERAYLQRCLGMCLAGRIGEVWFIALGQGSNGKSTTVKAVNHVMGRYAQTVPISFFLKQRYESGGPTPHEAMLPGARVWTAAEPKAGDVFDAGKIKDLTGGEKRSANPKNKDPFEYYPVGAALLQAQRMPIVDDPSHGFWRRCHPIQFKQTLDDLPESERRSEEYMKAVIKREASGILNWLLEGYAQFRAVGLDPPADVLELKQSLRAMADPVGQFLAEHTVKGTGLKVRTAELHKAFVAWSEKQNEKPMGAKGFTGAMMALDYVRRKSGGDWWWLGIDLADRSLLDGESR